MVEVVIQRRDVHDRAIDEELTAALRQRLSGEVSVRDHGAGGALRIVFSNALCGAAVGEAQRVLDDVRPDWCARYEIDCHMMIH